MESRGGPPAFPEPAVTATTLALSPHKTPGLQDPRGSSLPGPLPGTSSVSFLGLPPASSITAVMNTKSLPAPQAETSAKSPRLPGPRPHPEARRRHARSGGGRRVGRPTALHPK
jgi:hypothetical protein